MHALRELLFDFPQLRPHALADRPALYGEVPVPVFPADVRLSRPAESHHRPLAEPSVRLSPHSAPIRQTGRPYGPSVTRIEVLLFPVASGMRPPDPTPLLQPHYEPSSLVRVGPPQCSASVRSPRGFGRLGFSLRIRATGSCSSAQQPASASRPLYAGRRPHSHQAPRGPFPGGLYAPGFDDTCFLNDASSKGSLSFVSRMLTCTGLFPRFYSNAHHHGLLPQQLGSVWDLLLKADPEGSSLIYCAACDPHGYLVHIELLIRAFLQHTEAKKVERLRFPFSTPLPLVDRIRTKLQKSRFLGMQFQVELPHSFRKFRPKLIGLRFAVKAHHDVVRETHHDDIAVRALLTPCLDPQIEYVMKIDVCQKRRSTSALGRPFLRPYSFPILQHAGVQPFLDEPHNAPVSDPVLDELHQPFGRVRWWRGSGLRMMPTFPPPPLSFRTVGFPQYGWKVGLSDNAFPHVAQVKLPPTMPCASRRFASALRALRCPTLRPALCQNAGLGGALPCEESSPLPQRSSLRSGFYCPSPSTLNRPHPSHSQAHPDFAAWRFIRNALAVLVRLGDPRVVPCFRCAFLLDMPSTRTTESPSAALAQSFADDMGLRRRSTGSALPRLPIIRFRWAEGFRGFTGSLSLRPVELLVPLADLTGVSPSQPGLFLSIGSVTLPAVGYDYGGY